MMSEWKTPVEADVEAMGVAVPDVGALEVAVRLPGGRGECIPVLVFRASGCCAGN